MRELICPISFGSLHFPETAALITEERVMSYKELHEIIEGTCIFLRSLKVKEGSRIAFTSKTDWETIALFFAIFRLGAIACPLSFRIPQKKWEEQISRISPQLVIEPEKIEAKRVQNNRASVLNGSLVSTLLFTSGSSGAEKIAAHGLENHFVNAEGVLEALPLHYSDAWYLSLPLFHVGGLGILFRCFLAGCAVSLSEKRSSLLSLVPTQLYRLCKNPESIYAKKLILGGAPLSSALFQRAKKLNASLFTTYGLTEMSSQVTLDLSPSVHEEKVTAGKPMKGRELTLSPKGEIWVKGDSLFLGYYSKDGLACPMQSEGWFATGDLGAWTQEKKLIVLGRKDNLFISGGENILPEEIEQALFNLNEIQEAIVVPMDDPEFGARPVAFVAAENGFVEKELQEKLRDYLPGFKIPVRILQMPESRDLKRSRLHLRELL